MRYLQSSLSLCIAIVAIASTPADAAAKCRASPGHRVLPGYVLMVDGKIVGEYAMNASADMPPSEEIVAIEVVCRRAPTGDADSWAHQAVVFVLTKGGSPALFQSYLEELVEEQQAHHSRTGEYASDLSDLGFFDWRLPIPLEMEVATTGWSATARIQSLSTICHVAVGSAEPMRRSQRRGVPTCFVER
jgi:hypothetical protein